MPRAAASHDGQAHVGAYLRAAGAMWPVASGDALNGVAFGALASAAGLSLGASVTMSLTSFSASAQTATLGGLSHGQGLVQLVATAMALNARFLVFSAMIVSRLPPGRWRRVACCLCMSDASWALAQRSGAANGVDHRVLVGGGLASLAAWTAGTAMGAMGAKFLTSPAQLGLDAVLPALFLWMVLSRPLREAWPGFLLGLVVAMGLSPLLPAATSVLLAGAMGAAIGLLR